jgi:hypothetical protein
MRQPDSLQRKRVRLIIATCLGLTGAVAFILLYWIFSGSLEQFETVIAGIIFGLIMGGIGLLAQRGRVAFAAWLLVGGLTLLISADLTEYGVTTPASVSYVIPILLAAFCLGFWPAMAVAALGSSVGWVVAWMQTSSTYATPGAELSQLTFNAPILTVILFVSALMAGYWSQQNSE